MDADNRIKELKLWKDFKKLNFFIKIRTVAINI